MSLGLLFLKKENQTAFLIFGIAERKQEIFYFFFFSLKQRKVTKKSTIIMGRLIANLDHQCMYLFSFDCCIVCVSDMAPLFLVYVFCTGPLLFSEKFHPTTPHFLVNCIVALFKCIVYLVDCQCSSYFCLIEMQTDNCMVTIEWCWYHNVKSREGNSTLILMFEL